MATSPTRVRFTKMHGAGNDFVVLDATRAPLALDAAQIRRLGDRRFGVGADQILVVEPPSKAGMDFSYRIFNNTGDEDLVGADPEAAVAEAADLRVRQRQRRVRGVQHDEVVAGALHLGEAHAGRGDGHP